MNSPSKKSPILSTSRSSLVIIKPKPMEYTSSSDDEEKVKSKSRKNSDINSEVINLFTANQRKNSQISVDFSIRSNLNSFR